VVGDEPSIPLFRDNAVAEDTLCVPHEYEVDSAVRKDLVSKSIKGLDGTIRLGFCEIASVGKTWDLAAA
jgi:hypothetical protein